MTDDDVRKLQKKVLSLQEENLILKKPFRSSPREKQSGSNQKIKW